MRAAIYARVNITDQTCANQRRELRAYCEARRAVATEYGRGHQWCEEYPAARPWDRLTTAARA